MHFHSFISPSLTRNLPTRSSRTPSGILSSSHSRAVLAISETIEAGLILSLWDSILASMSPTVMLVAIISPNPPSTLDQSARLLQLVRAVLYVFSTTACVSLLVPSKPPEECSKNNLRCALRLAVHKLNFLPPDFDDLSKNQAIYLMVWVYTT